MRLIIGLILSLLVLGAGEMVVRRIMPTDPCMRRDELLGFSLKPGSSCWRQSRDFKVAYQINSLGLRDEKTELEKKEGWRILMLGDSFTEGTGVKQEETFSALLEKALGIEVVNAGVSGYSPLQEYLWLKDQGLKLNPDLVILNLNATDFSEADKYHQIWKQNGYTNLQLDKPSFLASIRLVQLMRERLEKLLKPRPPAVFVVSEAYWQLVRSDISRINFLTSGKNIPLLVVWQPHGQQVSATAWGDGRLVHGFKVGKKYPTDIPKWLDDLAQQKGFDFLDLSPAFEATDAAQLYFPYDGHWTAEGHKLVAKVLGEYLNDYLF